MNYMTMHIPRMQTTPLILTRILAILTLRLSPPTSLALLCTILVSHSDFSFIFHLFDRYTPNFLPSPPTIPSLSLFSPITAHLQPTS